MSVSPQEAASFKVSRGADGNCRHLAPSWRPSDAAGTILTALGRERV